jgi:hypothetical protein
MLPKETMEECVKIARTHPAVARLIDAYNIMANSPYLDSYMVVYDLIEGWQGELKEHSSKIKLLNAEDKAFDRAFKLSTSMPDLIAGLDSIRDKMSPEQKEDADKKRKAKKSEGKIII